VHGFTGAFVAGVGIAAIGVLAALALIRRSELEEAAAPQLDVEPALEAAA